MRTAEQARQDGLNIDKTCYPWMAYKGPRFEPEFLERVLTDKEARPSVTAQVFLAKGLTRDKSCLEGDYLQDYIFFGEPHEGDVIDNVEVDGKPQIARILERNWSGGELRIAVTVAKQYGVIPA